MNPISDGIATATIGRIPHRAAWVLQLGGAPDALKSRFQAINPKGRYLILDPDGEPLSDDRDHIEGDASAVEAQSALTERLAGATLDAVVCLDPQTLAASLPFLQQHMTDGTVVITLTANAAGATHLGQILRGGAVDPSARDHLSAVRTVRATGLYAFSLEGVGSATDATAIRALEQAAGALGVPAETARERVAAEAWLVRAARAEPTGRLTVVALGLPKKAGVTDARVDHPMAALGSLPHVTAAWGAGTVSFPREARPGVFMLHRQFLNGSTQIAMVQSMIDKGWAIVSEIDDDPHHWREYVDSNFRAFRGVHAVSVSTEPLARMIRQWTPEVRVFPNQIAALPDAPRFTPKSATGRMRLFFGALNRGADWAAIVAQVVDVAVRHADRLELVVVHDQAFFDALPDGVHKVFHPTLPHPAYMMLLASCDLALLPLADTAFNRLKSDLKLIECAAAGVVPLCSPTVYADEPRNVRFARIIQDPVGWGDALLELLVSPGDVRHRREAGLAYVSAERMHAGHVTSREAWLQDLVARRDELEVARRARLQAAGLPVV